MVKSATASTVGRRMVEQLDALIAHGDPRIALARTRVHGAVVIEADIQRLRARFLCQPPTANGERLYDTPEAVPGRHQYVFEVDAQTRSLRADLQAAEKQPARPAMEGRGEEASA